MKQNHNKIITLFIFSYQNNIFYNPKDALFVCFIVQRFQMVVDNYDCFLSATLMDRTCRQYTSGHDLSITANTQSPIDQLVSGRSMKVGQCRSWRLQNVTPTLRVRGYERSSTSVSTFETSVFALHWLNKTQYTFIVRVSSTLGKSD